MSVEAARGLSAAYERAMAAGDIDGVTQSLAADVILNSPITPKPFRGREQVAFVLKQIMEVFEDLRFTDVLEAGCRVGVVFAARIGDREAQGLDYLTFDGDGLICEFTVMMRPLSAAVALQNAMAPRFGATPVTLTRSG